MAAQAGRLAYAHGGAFTTEPLEAYAREVAVHLPVDAPAIYPVSGGSEAIETALKLARAYHIARGETERWIVYGRWGSYHGNTLGALDLSGRRTLRRPYEGWLGRFRHVSAAYPYRADLPGSQCPRFGRGARGRARPGVRGGRPGHRRGVRRRADRRRHAGGRRPTRRLLAGDRRRLPPSWGAAHRRRGHDRLRPDRSLVRARSLGDPGGHPGGRQGRGVGLLAVRLRRGIGRRPRHGHRRLRVRPRLHLLARPGRRGGRARGPAHPRDRVAGRGERRERGATR